MTFDQAISYISRLMPYAFLIETLFICFLIWRNSSLGRAFRGAASRHMRAAAEVSRLEKIVQFKGAFSVDSEFMVYLIGFKVSQVKRMVFEASLVNTKVGIVNNKTFEDSLESITSEVLSCMSQEYKGRLARYIDPPRIKEFVIEHVMAALIMAVNSTNSRHNVPFQRGALGRAASHAAAETTEFTEELSAK